jgi:hypothetical protein
MSQLYGIKTDNLLGMTGIKCQFKLKCLAFIGNTQ